MTWVSPGVKFGFKLPASLWPGGCYNMCQQTRVGYIALLSSWPYRLYMYSFTDHIWWWWHMMLYVNQTNNMFWTKCMGMINN